MTAGREKLDYFEHMTARSAQMTADVAPGSNALTGAITSEETPFTVSLLQRMEVLMKTLYGAESSVCALRERMLGAWPQQSDSPTGTKSAAQTRAEELHEALSHLQMVADRIVDHASILNARI